MGLFPLVLLLTPSFNTDITSNSATASAEPVSWHGATHFEVSDRYHALYQTDSMHFTEKGFSPYEVPVYTDEVYKAKIDAIDTDIPLTFNRDVKGYINMYLYRKRWLSAKVIGRSYNYFPLFEEVLKEKNMPEELKYLAIVESAIHTEAVSWCGAAGIWQFMPATARIYKMRVDSIDERKDPRISTYAAAEYLKDLHGIYNDWLLAIAAYNCGPGTINKAFKKARYAKVKGTLDFWKIKRFLPEETQGYVPAFIASAYMMKHYREHNIRAINPSFATAELSAVAIQKNVDFYTLSEKLQVTPEEIAFFNPAYQKEYKFEVKDSIPRLVLPATLILEFHTVQDEVYALAEAKTAAQTVFAK